MALEPEVAAVLSQMQTTVKLYGDQLKVLMERIDTLLTHDRERAALDQDRHQNLKDEIDLMKVTREAESEQMVNFQQGLDRLEETTVALMNITNDMQPIAEQHRLIQQRTLH